MGEIPFEDFQEMVDYINSSTEWRAFIGEEIPCAIVKSPWQRGLIEFDLEMMTLREAIKQEFDW